MRWKRNKERRPRLLPWDLRLLLAVLILAILGTISFSVYQRMALSADLERLRIAGKPLSHEEFHSQYHPSPEAIEAGSAFREAIDEATDARVSLNNYSQQYPRAFLLPLRDFPKDQPHENDLKEALADHLAKNRRALLLFERACECEGCYLQPQGIAAPALNTSGMLLGMSGDFCASACLHAESGDPIAATHSLELAFHTSRILTHASSDVRAHHRSRCYAKAVESLERVLSRATLSEPQLSGLHEAALQQYDPEVAKCALARKRCEAIATFLPARQSRHDRLEHDDDSRSPAALRSLIRMCERAAGLQHLRLRQFLTFAEQCERALGRMPAETMMQMTALVKEQDAIERKLINPDVLPSMLLISLYRWLHLEAQIKTAVTGIAVERYRLRHSCLPDSLDALVPDFLETVPREPFTKTNLKYERLEPGYKVYCDLWYGKNGRLSPIGTIDFEVLR